MSVEVTMPQLSDTMSEGTILTWLKKEGDYVKRGDALAEVATDKADLEIESFHEGTLAKINTPAGTKVKVGAVIAVIGDGATNVAVPSTAPVAVVQPIAAPVVTTPSAAVSMPRPVPVPTASATVEERVKISPLARNVAMVHGIDVSQVHGSGDGGRIVKRDIDPLIENLGGHPAVAPVAVQSTVTQIAATSSAATQSVVARPAVPQPTAKHFEPLSRMRSVIAQRMVESVTTIPHFYVTSRVMMNEVTRLKNSLKTLPQYEGITFNHIILKAVALALRAHPVINSAFKDGGVAQPGEINIGIVTAVPGGLMIPVVKRADQQSLADIVADARGLVQRARAGRPKQEDLVDGTFSISNMGPHAVESFTAIISPGQGAILAVSAIETEPVVVDGAIKIADVMRLTLSVDHRIIDGVMAGAYLTELRRLLENPVLLLA